MTKLLEQAFSQAAELSGEEQDVLARWLMAELASEHRWLIAFDASADMLEKMADEALAEESSGRTSDMDPDRL